MATFKISLFSILSSLALISGSVLGAADDGTNKNIPSASSTESPPPTIKPSISTTPVPTTVPPPVTTTAAPSTTTVVPSTTKVAPSTTTVLPSTTSTPPPTPAPPTHAPPTPAPLGPSPGKWNITEGNMTCAVFQCAITINLQFTDKDNKTEHFPIYVPSSATVYKPSCGLENAEQTMNLVWNPGHLKMVFALKDKKDYYLESVDGFINVTMIPSLANKTSAANFTLTYQSVKDAMALKGSVNSSYECNAPSAVKMNNGTELQLAGLKYQAFITDGSGKFGPAQNCIEESSPDIVPILVAGGLILLVILVLVAYIVTRRRGRGYTSM